MGMREASAPTRSDALGEIQLRLRSRPLPEVLAALDRHAELVPELAKGFRAALARGDRAAAGMQLMVALDDRP